MAEAVITVGNYPDLASAHLAQSVLEAEGIDSVIPDENLAGIDWQMGTALHGVRLQVAAEDADDARALLATLLVEDDAVPDPAEPHCPRCGSADIRTARWKHRLKAVTLFMPILLLIWPIVWLIPLRRTCNPCGNRWT